VILGDRTCVTTLLLLVTCYHWGSINMPIPFGKAFSYGTFLQYLRSPGPNALCGRPTVSREHWLRGLFLLTYCTNEPISARISAILHRLLHGGVAALFLSSDSSYLCNCRKTSHAMTHCLTSHTKNYAEHFQGNQHGGPHAFTDDNFSLEKSGWIKKQAVFFSDQNQ